MSPSTPSFDPKYDWDRNPSRHVPPTLTVPPPDYPVEISHFSPESHRSPNRSHPQHARSRSDWTNTTTVKSLANDPELGKTYPYPPQAPHVRNRVSKFFFDLRMPTRTLQQEWYPMQEPPLQTWPPLEGEKHHRVHCEQCQERNDRRRRNKALFVALVILLLYLLGNVVFLNVRVVRISQPSTSTTATSTTPANASDSSALSADAQSCLSQFSLNAPSSPQSYPCSSCLSVLQGVPSSFTPSNTQDAQQLVSAVQFCGLRSIFETANSDGQSGLSNGGWVKDVRFCAWSGVHCDGFGRVSSMYVFCLLPRVPYSFRPADNCLSQTFPQRFLMRSPR